MCGGNIKAVGPIKKLTSPLQSVTREILYNRYEQLGRWVQQFYLPYSKHNSINDAKLKHMESLSKMDDLDSEQTIEELSKVITEMTSCKTPDSDSIPDCSINASSVYFPSYIIFLSNVAVQVKCHKTCVTLRLNDKIKNV